MSAIYNALFHSSNGHTTIPAAGHRETYAAVAAHNNNRRAGEYWQRRPIDLAYVQNALANATQRERVNPDKIQHLEYARGDRS